jgi:hypothetical protein
VRGQGIGGSVHDVDGAGELVGDERPLSDAADDGRVGIRAAAATGDQKHGNKKDRYDCPSRSLQKPGSLKTNE